MDAVLHKPLPARTLPHPPGGRARAAGSGDGWPALVDTHAALLWRLSALADEVLAGLSDGAWPGGDLADLVDCLGRDLMALATAEEAEVFPAVLTGARAAADDVARFGRDHARLRSGAGVLAGYAAAPEGADVRGLAAVVRSLVVQIDRHLAAEDVLLDSAAG